MALQDIIDALVAHADHEIAALRADHARHTRERQERHAHELAKLHARAEEQRTARQDLLRRKTMQHASADRSHQLIGVKRSLIDGAFATLIGRLSSLSESEAEPILRWSLRRLRGKGTLHPSARHAELLRRLAPSDHCTIGSPIDAVGGFRFVSKTVDVDATFERLVHDLLRPQEELAVAGILFPA